jgi:hypothetical protein
MPFGVRVAHDGLEPSGRKSDFQGAVFDDINRSIATHAGKTAPWTHGRCW